MYTLLIVDDEPELADGLSEMFQELKEPELIVYKAYSAKEALVLMNRIKIDIILTDIRMPGMTGLKLVEEIKLSWPYCRAIFLTGYTEFEYVYTAIQNQGVRYLLKTEGDDKIISAVKDTIYEIEESMKEEHILLKAKLSMERALPLLQKQFFEDLFDGSSNLEEITQEQLSELNIPLDKNDEMLLIVGKLDQTVGLLTIPEKDKRLLTLLSIAEPYIPSEVFRMNFVLERNYAVWILQPVTREISALKGNLEYIQNASRLSLGATVSFAINSESFQPRLLSERFTALKRILSNHSYTDKEMILTEKSFVSLTEGTLPAEELSSLRNVSKKLNKLKLLEAELEAGQKKEFDKLLSEIVESLRGVRSKGSQSATELYYNIALLFLNYMNRWGIGDKISERIDVHKLVRTDTFVSWNEAVDYLHRFSDALFEIQFLTKDKKVKDSITVVLEHIEANLHEDISLVRMADLVNLNASYLSRLFKEVTGKNLSDYINEIRINKAKVLLAGKSLKINEVAKVVGYYSPHSFARFFRNTVGMSPQDYRDSLAKKS